MAKVFQLKESGAMTHLHEMEEAALKAGVGATNPSKINKRDPSALSSTNTAIVRLWKAHEDGCDSCNHTGYRGRMGIYEVLRNTDSIQQLIVGNATSEKLQAQAVEDGMLTMQTDGLVKALRAQTSIEEILRVTAEKA
jgi:type II secretory ATPase GspE/PulE/Tfp pilus assembly ATPase PilB-like protein